MFQDEPPRQEPRGIPWGSDQPPPPMPEAAERPARPRWRGADILVGVGLLFAGYLALIVAFVILAVGIGIDAPVEAFTVETAAVLVVFELWLLGVVVILARRRGITLADIGFVAPRRWGMLPIGVIACYLAIGAYTGGVLALDRALPQDLSRFAEGNPIPVGDYPLEVWIVLGIGVVVLAPIAEEVFFRGFLFRAIESFWPTSLAMLASGIAFSLVHFNVAVLIPFAIIGVIFAWIYKASGSLWTPIGAHAIVNGVSFILTVVAVEF